MKKELSNICKLRTDKHNGYIVFYKANKKEVWNPLQNQKRLLKFINGLIKKKIKFKVFRCSSKKQMNKEDLRKLLCVSKNSKIGELMLDDHD